MALEDILLAVVALIVGIVVVNFLVNSATIGKQGATPEVKASPKQKQPRLKKPSKKELAAKAREEAELEALIAREATSTAGMAKDKHGVVTLDDLRERQHGHVKKGSAATAASATAQQLAAAEFSVKQKISEKAQGFQIVEDKKEDTRRSAPGREAEAALGSPTTIVTKKQLLSEQLSSFLRKKDQSRRGKPPGGAPYGGEAPHTAAVEASKEVKGGRVDVKRTITRSDPRGLWDGQRQWAPNN